MIVEKVLNNNVVVSIDPNTRKEVILMGSGIAFNKKPGQLIDDKKIEKTFIVTRGYDEKQYKRNKGKIKS